MTSLLSSKFFPRSLTWSGPVPVGYSAHFSLNRIMPGVDNFHYDIHLSPVFRETASRIIFNMILRSSKADEDLDIGFDWQKEREEFKRLCRDIMLDAVKKAKMGDGEIQVDYLAQISVSKYLIQEVAHQFEELMTRLNNQVWEYESTDDDVRIGDVNDIQFSSLAECDEQRYRRQGSGTNGKTFADGSCGVAQCIQTVGDFAGFRSQFSHF